MPAWAKDLKLGARMINARSETVHEKPAFRSAFRRRRCVIPVNGWFEWRREGGEKQPYWIRPADAEAFSLAGLWERWDRGEEPVETFTILTTEVSPALADIHHRQPVIVGDGEVDAWLDPASPFERIVETARAAFAGPVRPVAGEPRGEQLAERRAGAASARRRVSGRSLRRRVALLLAVLASPAACLSTRNFNRRRKNGCA